ncbi:MAG TPA: helix-turn-helix transcriptional regulator [Clostridiaceae bacterium]|jgi:AraC-like DNA-binding protein|nr:helix-turn-helix transcriptional regulator [Clostridiaceae bacterium]
MRQRSELHGMKTGEHLDIFNNKPFNQVKCYFHDTYYMGAINMHKHNFYELNMVTRGTGLLCMDKDSTVVEEGNVFLILPNVEHGYMIDNNLIVFHMLLHSNFISRYSKELNSLSISLQNNLNITLDKSELDEIMNLLIELDQLQRSSDTSSDIMKNSLSLYLICRLSRHMPEKDKNDEKTYSEGIVKCVEYMNLNYKESINMKKICSMLGVSYSTLRRYFMGVYEMTPSDYLRELRIRHAIDLLKNSDKPILEIALECGFYDRSHFNRTFKDKTGYTPHAYRNIQL